MNTFHLTTIVIVLVGITYTSADEPVLPCASCAQVNCGDPPQNCELDKVPCGCCPACVRLEGQKCEAFAPRCGYGLKCLTAAGLLDGRPKWYQQFLLGICVKDPSIVQATSAPRA